MSASESAKHSGDPTRSKESDTRRSYPKTHANYWKAGLEHRTYTREGQTFEIAEWSVRIHFGNQGLMDVIGLKRPIPTSPQYLQVLPDWVPGDGKACNDGVTQSLD